MTFAAPYILLVIFFLLLAVYEHYSTDENKSVYIPFVCAGTLLLFFGLRGFIFYDWSAYYPIFTALPDFHTLFTENVSKWLWEPGFIILGVLCKTIIPNYFFFAFICSFISIILLIRFLKKYTYNLPLSLAIFLAMGGTVLLTDLMRNSIAIFIFINSIEYLIKRKPIQYFLLCGIAICFHVSSVVYLPLYFFINKNINKWVLLGIFAGANIVYLLHISIFMPVLSLILDYIAPSTKLWLEAYTKMEGGAAFALGVGYIERLLTGFLMFCYFDKLREYHHHNSIFVNSLMLYLFIFLFLSEFRTMSVRASTLFSFAYWIVWMDLIRCFFYRNNRLLFTAFVGIYCIFKVYGNCSSALARYQNILWDSPSYNESIVYFRLHLNDKD